MNPIEVAAVCRRQLMCAITLLLGVSLSACASSGHDRLPSLGVAELSGESQVARVTLGSHYFEPSRLMVQVGVPVRLVLQNDTLLTGHDFSLFAPDAGLELDAYVPARQQVTVQFIPSTVGEYDFYCNIDDHAEQGQTGTLVVIEELGTDR